MQADAKKLQELIESNDKILITSHISPDPDAVSSLLLTGVAINANFPQKKVAMVLEEEPVMLKFLDGYNEIIFQNIAEAVKEQLPDLIILLDGNNFDRVSRHDGDKVRQLIADRQIKTVIIDHHELTGRDDADILINRHDPATAQTAYELLFKDLGLNQPAMAAQTALTGYYADTGGFV
jgi:phosphoesterase RecJ-like protein